MLRPAQSISSIIIPVTMINSSGGNATGEAEANFRVWVYDYTGAVVTGFNGMTPDTATGNVSVTEIGSTGVYLIKFPASAAVKAFLTSNQPNPYTVVIDTVTTGIDPACHEVWIGATLTDISSQLNELQTAVIETRATSYDAAVDAAMLRSLYVIPSGPGTYAAITEILGITDSDANSGGLYYKLMNGLLPNESYAPDGVTPTLSQMLYMIYALLSQTTIVGTTMTCRKLDGSTTAMTYTLDSATTPTSKTRAT